MLVNSLKVKMCYLASYKQKKVEEKKYEFIYICDQWVAVPFLLVKTQLKT